MLSACSSKPQILAPIQISEIKEQYPADLLVYCEKAQAIKSDDLQTVLKRVVYDYGLFAKCIDKQKGLVDAVRRKEQSK